jgi:hypothetical protein
VSGLREAAERTARMGRLASPLAKRKLEMEKACDRLVNRETGSAREREPWDEFLRRIGIIGG